ncbi:MAG: hypothetical protein ACTS45_01130 [Candidatus Hodgkinia cicadicola]
MFKLNCITFDLQSSPINDYEWYLRLLNQRKLHWTRFMALSNRIKRPSIGQSLV